MNPNQGLIAKKYMIILIAAVVIVLAALLLAVSSTHSLGKSGPTTSPASTEKSNPHPQ